MLKPIIFLLLIFCIIPISSASSNGEVDGISAADTPALFFSIKDCTDDYSLVDKNPGFDQVKDLRIPPSVKHIELVTFDQSQINNNIRSKPPKLIVQIRGVDYPADVERMNFESIDDGIDSYSGTLVGQKTSSVVLTISEEVTTGEVMLNGESFYISPVKRVATSGTTKILHSIYSSREVVDERKVLIDHGTVTPSLQPGYPDATPTGISTVTRIVIEKSVLNAPDVNGTLQENQTDSGTKNPSTSLSLLVPLTAFFVLIMLRYRIS